MELFPLWNSIRISFLATMITLVVGVAAAYYIERTSKICKGILDTLLTIPLVLPPTVVGYVILITLSPKSKLGGWVKAYFHTTITMKWYAAVIAVVIMTFPLMYRTVRSTLEAFDSNMLAAGRSLGLSNTYLFWHVLLPNCKSGILAGVVLSFARGLGEYGATSMVAGYIANQTATIATTVAYYWQTNQQKQALFWVMINLGISFVVMFIVNYYENKGKKDVVDS